MRLESIPDHWEIEHPDRIQLFSIATPNGQKAGIALEEMELPYEAHRIDIMKGDQHQDAYKPINPNEKIPAIVDPDGPGGKPLAIMESGAVLTYLAEKSGKLLPEDPRARWEVIQWVYFQAGSVGPMFGQFGHFYKFAKGKTDDYGEQRYGAEAKRLLGVLDRQLEGKQWLVEDYSIADIMIVPWINALEFYEGKDYVDYDSFEHVNAWVDRFNEREAVQRGVQVTPF